MNLIINILYKPYEILFIPLYHCILELLYLTGENIKPISRAIFICVISFASASTLGYHQQALWCLKWVGLGIMSSVGFGFGMHTFVLFLAPHIAAVTLASASCKSLNFPEPPYPDAIICPVLITPESQITFFNILQKVALESFMWGLGTAIGELPPYLAARVKGQTISRMSGDNLASNSQVAGWERLMIQVINKIGFIGILLCAAIPNPLFDAAGVASGIAQVPFLSFFGATFIGKAVIKVLLQSSFVIFIFHTNYLDSLIVRLGKSFSYTRDLNLHGLIDEQRKKFTGGLEPDQTSKIGTIFGWLTSLLMILFTISLINALSQQYKDRIGKTARRIE